MERGWATLRAVKKYPQEPEKLRTNIVDSFFLAQVSPYTKQAEPSSQKTRTFEVGVHLPQAALPIFFFLKPFRSQVAGAWRGKIRLSQRLFRHSSEARLQHPATSAELMECRCEGSVLHPGITPLGNNPEWFKITRFYPEMCLNGVNTQWVYSQGVLQKPLEQL